MNELSKSFNRYFGENETVVSIQTQIRINLMYFSNALFFIVVTLFNTNKLSVAKVPNNIIHIMIRHYWI